MSSTAKPTASLLFHALVAHLGIDAVTQLKGVLKNAASNIEKNPTTLELVAQGVALQGALIGIGPVLQSDAIQKAANTLGQLIDTIPEPVLPDSDSASQEVATPATASAS